MELDSLSYKAVILAGGKGTRLYPITKEIPKPLIPIKRKPIINHLVDLFFLFGVKNIGILINKEFREDFYWWQKRYYPLKKLGQTPNVKIFEEEKELGTFGGLYLLKKWLGNNHFFLTNGDELKKIDLDKMKEFHRKKDIIATIALVKVPDPNNYGLVVCKKGMVEEFLEKPSLAEILKRNLENNAYINAGLYLFSPDIFDYHPGFKFLMVEKDIFPKLAREKKLAGFKFKGKWMDCGTWERYENALEKWI